MLPPDRPEVALTGVLDTDGSPGLALVNVASGRRVVQVGDVLPKNYRVKRITKDTVELVNGRDRFTVSLGKKPEGLAKPLK